MGKFKIAHNLIEISLLYQQEIEEILPSFLPFKTEGNSSEEVMLRMEGVPYKSLNQVIIIKTLTKETNGLGSWTLHEIDGGYCIDLTFEEGFPSHRMICNHTFSDCKMAIFFGEPHGKYVLDSFVMMAYAQCCALHHTAMLHASVIKKGNKGYAFLGDSGTGKSTHSQLWLSHIPDTELVNDDNPAIRVMSDGTTHIFGTPWSGKTDCYKNIEVEINGFVLLKQAKENQISLISPIQAFLTLIGSCSTLRWNAKLFNALGQTIEYVTNHAKLYKLENTPTKEAAWLSYQTLSNLQ